MIAGADAAADISIIALVVGVCCGIRRCGGRSTNHALAGLMARSIVVPIATRDWKGAARFFGRGFVVDAPGALTPAILRWLCLLLQIWRRRRRRWRWLLLWPGNALFCQRLRPDLGHSEGFSRLDDLANAAVALIRCGQKCVTGELFLW